jgi:hypothetical protein
MFRSPAQKLQYVSPGLVSLAALSLYWVWLAPSVATIFDDSLELQLVSYRLGIAHPTGYPLYTLLGKLFTYLPLGDVAYRVNLMSAVFGGLTVGLVYLLGLALARSVAAPGWQGQAGALLGAAMFATSPVVASQATIAEVYTLNAAFVAATLLLALRFDRPGTGRTWPMLIFVYGLSLTHHRTMVLLASAMGLYLRAPRVGPGQDRPLSQIRSWLSWKSGAVTALAFGLPLALYLYLPLRAHVGSLDGTYQDSWTGFWRQVTAGGYGVFIFANPFGNERTLAFYLDFFLEQFGWLGLLLLAVGVAALIVRRRWRVLLLSAGAFVSYTAFNILYAVTDIQVFFIPAILIGAVWLAVGVQELASLAARAGGAPWWGGLAAAFMLIGLLAPALARLGAADLDRSQDWAVYDYGQDLLEQPFPPNSAVVGILGEMTLIRYFQDTAGLQPALQTVAADREPDRLRAVSQSLAAGKTVFLTRPLPGAAERWSLSAVGPLIQVLPEPATAAPADITPVAAPLAEEITLLGYHLSHPPSHRRPAPLRLTLYWQALGLVPIDLKVSARLVAGTGEEMAVDDAVPVHFAYPTTAWRPGEVVADVYELSPSPEAKAGQVVTPLIILYDPARNAAEVGRVTLEPLALQ